MSKTAVVYRSKSGFTEKYARWIAAATGADLLDGRSTRLRDLLPYDTIVYGGALYAAGINGLSLITKNFEALKDKKLIVFTLGATPVRPEIVDEVRNKNLRPEQQHRVRFFMLRGGFDKARLSPVDRVLMTLLKMKLKSRKNPTADERGMLSAYGHPQDFTDEKRVAPIVAAVLEE
jgi:menaquinone-dependent protoporphyrinogen IX oxidase